MTTLSPSLCASWAGRPSSMPSPNQRRVSRLATLLGLATLAFLATSSAVADEVVVGASQDATLFEDADGDLASGAGSFLFVGWGNAPKRALLQFDLDGAIPAGSVIQSAELTLYMSRTIVSGIRNDLHRVTRAWSEGPADPGGQEGQGEMSLPGDVTWIHTDFDSALWDNPGGDFIDTSSADIVVNQDGYYTWGSTPEMVSDVQLWIDDGASNHGWILIGAEAFFMSAKRFDSRENADPTRRPQLRINFQPPSSNPLEVPTLGGVGLALLVLFLLGAALRAFPRP